MAVNEFLNGNEACGNGVRLSRPQVIPTYPITPQAPLLTHIARDISQGRLSAKFLNMESDQSAIAAAIGASLAGTRVFTATNSQGLAYMSEHLFFASGLRLPIVMAIVNRAMSAPHCRFADQNDALAQNRTGWIQLFCEDAQEVLDTCIQMFKICENKGVLLPGMFCYESYIHSHTYEPVNVPDVEQAKEYLSDFVLGEIILDPDKPMTINAATSSDFYMEFKAKQHEGMSNALNVIEDANLKFRDIFDRDYGGLIEIWPDDKTEIYITTMGSIAKTTRQAIIELRENGIKAGLLKIRSYRPFPYKKVEGVLKDAKTVIIIDRNNAPGSIGALYGEIQSSLYNLKGRPEIYGIVAGLGGRDVTIEEIKELVHKSIKGNLQREYWIGLKNGFVS